LGSDNLDELEEVHDELVNTGIKDRQIHVLSEQEAEVSKHHMRNLNSLSRTSLFSFLMRGSVLGLFLGGTVLLASYVFGAAETVMMAPFWLAAIAAFGFTVWEAGLMGLNRINQRYETVQNELHHGEHMLILDYASKQQAFIDRVLRRHPKVCAVQL